MSIKRFFKLVEIQTKVASVIPFILGTLYALYRFGDLMITNMIFMFLSMIAFDMATTAINNYIDYKKANKTHGYGYESHNAIVKYKLKEVQVVAVIIALLAFASAFGILLYLHTDIVILLLGALSFVVGVAYSFGPVPISRTPLGELLSGFFMGFIIVFISVYIHIYDKNIIFLALKNGILNINVSLAEILYIFLVSIPTILCIANIMLANNICDIEDDIENRRYTLPIYIGKQASLKLFAVLYYLCYIDIAAMAALKIISLPILLALFTLPLIRKNILIFMKHQTKKDTFVMSVKSFVTISSGYILSLGICIILKLIF